ncbi:hypothetical protein GCM10028783_01270 [Modestobacter muralis]
MSARAELVEQGLPHVGLTGVGLASVEAAPEPTAHPSHLAVLALLLERGPERRGTLRTACVPPSSRSTASERCVRTVLERLTTWT